MKLHYQVEITGGFFPIKKVLKGAIEDIHLIKEIQLEKVVHQKNMNVRDGLTYKISLNSQNYAQEYIVNETELTENLQKLIAIAHQKDV